MVFSPLMSEKTTQWDYYQDVTLLKPAVSGGRFSIVAGVLVPEQAVDNKPNCTHPSILKLQHA